MFGQATYITFELAWAIPVLALHWIVGSRLLRPRIVLLLLAAGLPTIYLTAADSVALRQGIWILHADRIVGLHIGNVPIEECIFFLVTNLLVAQTVVLFVLSAREKQAAGMPRGRFRLGIPARRALPLRRDLEQSDEKGL